MKNFTLCLLAIGLLSGIYPAESQAGHQRQNNRWEKSCMFNQSYASKGHCFSYWNDTTYVETIYFTEPTELPVEYVNRNPKEGRSIKKDSIKYKEGDLVYSLKVKESDYNYFTLQKIAAEGTSNTPWLVGKGHSDFTVKIDHSRAGTLTFYDDHPTDTATYEHGSCPRQIEIIAETNHGGMYSLTFYWEAPVEPTTGLPLFPPTDPRNPGSLDNLPDYLAKNFRSLRSNLTDLQRLEHTQELNLAINGFRRKMIRCEDDYACATDKAQIMFEKYNEKIDIIISLTGPTYQNILEKFIQAMEIAMQQYQSVNTKQ